MKKAIFLMIILIGGVHAQFDNVDMQIASCNQRCCSVNGGAWDNQSQNCLINQSSKGYYNYYSCSDSCMSNATGQIQGIAPSSGSLCCPPGFLLLCLVSVVLLRR